MHEMTSLLDFDRAESAFKLMFLFVRDDLSSEDEQSTFDGALKEILRGVRIPPGASEKLYRIYSSVLVSPADLPGSTAAVMRDFGSNRELLAAIVSLILRLVSDEGMISRRHCSDLREVLERFSFTAEEFELFSEHEKQLLGYALAGETFTEWGLHSKELLSAYTILGCPPSATDDEVRRAYRSLAMKYHPDRAAPLDLGEGETKKQQRQFQKVQTAYDAVSRARTTQSEKK